MDLTGQKFGRLTVIEKAEASNNHGILWRCKCDCGNVCEVRSNYLRGGQTQSCGCYRSELSAQIAKRMGEANVKHGKCRRGKRDPLFNVWYTMKARCKYPHHISYQNYGARGITVCDEWQEFESFYEWAMANGYKKGLEIDRIDCEGNYEPSNCRFVTRLENSRNKRNTTYLTAHGERRPLVEWAEILNVNMRTIWSRLNRGWSEEEALFGKAP